MRIGVVGSGITGLGAAWLLREEHETHLFESASRLGGHAHAVTVETASGKYRVDVGFLVYNEQTYPHLTQLFRYLKVPTAETVMSLSVANGGIEWGGTSLRTLFAQRRNLFRPGFYRMLRDIVWLSRNAERLCEQYERQKLTLNDLFARVGLSSETQDWYLIPMGAAIWSMPVDKMGDFPAGMFLRFCLNHGLFRIFDRPIWRTVVGSSAEYVERIAKDLKYVHLNEPALAAWRENGRCFLKTPQSTYDFDHLVFATHPPETLRILKDPLPDESAILGAFAYQANRADLHRDENTMPSCRKTWSAWNFKSHKTSSTQTPVSVTYHLNQLQPLPDANDIFVSLNTDVAASQLKSTFQFEHPVFTQNAIDNQNMLSKIQGIHRCFFGGAWARYGFHEDGLLSAVEICGQLGVRPPWN